MHHKTEKHSDLWPDDTICADWAVTGSPGPPSMLDLNKSAWKWINGDRRSFLFPPFSVLSSGCSRLCLAGSEVLTNGCSARPLTSSCTNWRSKLHETGSSKVTIYIFMEHSSAGGSNSRWCRLCLQLRSRKEATCKKSRQYMRSLLQSYEHQKHAQTEIWKGTLISPPPASIILSSLFI